MLRYLVASLKVSIAHTAEISVRYCIAMTVNTFDSPAITALVDATAGIMCFTTPNKIQFV
jgi:hypothetical protein